MSALVTAYFRQDFNDPKRAHFANIIIAADDNYALYVNGEFIGQGYNYRQSQSYCVKLDSTTTTNIFAVTVQNQGTAPNPAALLAAINVIYIDGSSTTVVSDATWRANNQTVAEFESVGFDDSAWPYAVSVDSPPWGLLPSPPPSNSTLSLASSYWIWNNQVPPGSPTSTAPVGSFAFRKTYQVPGGSLVDSGTIVIDVDDEYTLYINGNEIGSGNSFTKAQRWTFSLQPSTNNIVLAINATNGGGPAGLIAAVAFHATTVGCSTNLVKVTDGTPDGTWKFNLGVPAGFEQPGYDDSNWGSTIVEGPYGVTPWGSVPVVDGSK